MSFKSSWDALEAIGEVDELVEYSVKIANEHVDELAEIIKKSVAADHVSKLVKLIKHYAMIRGMGDDLEGVIGKDITTSVVESISGMLLVNLYELYRRGYEDGKKVGKLEKLYGCPDNEAE